MPRQVPLSHDAMTRAVYSVDASICEVTPQAVCIPRSVEELVELVNWAREEGTPLAPRGGGTSVTGACLTAGISIDCSIHLNQILEINTDEQFTRVQPGITLDALNRALRPHGYQLGVDLSTSNRATLGGMAANNAAGGRSLYYGTTADQLLDLHLVTSDGAIRSIHNFAKMLTPIGNKYREAIEQRFPKLRRRASGYDLPAILSKEWPRLAAGSQGTLGLFSELKLKIVPIPEKLQTALLPFPDLLAAVRAIPELLEQEPHVIELVDQQIIQMGRLSPAMRGKLGWLAEDTQALLIVQGPRLELPHLVDNLVDENIAAQAITLRKSGVGLLLSRRSHSRAIAFIEDLTVPPARVEDFLRELQELLRAHGKEAGIYGHAAEGCLHIRPYLDLRSETELMWQLLEEITEMIKRYDGFLSGEHGDGLIRSWLLPQAFGTELTQAMEAVKECFDPFEIMNPGKVVRASRPDACLRGMPVWEPKTFFRFAKDGGIAFAANMCNGNAACRKKEGVMCPSFQVTGREYDSTRARAQALRSIFNGKLPKEEWQGHELKAILDLCIECRGCKTECPSQVDMAKMKAEFLHAYHKKHRRSLRDWLLANVSLTSHLRGRLVRLSPPRALLRQIGITTERPLPKLAKKRFSRLVRASPAGDLVLLNDTFNEFFEPQIGQAAVAVLERLGHRVLVAPYHCCGRPLISKGYLEKAKRYAQRLVNVLAPFAEQGLKIVGIEPSCLLTIREDYPDLLDGEAVRRVAEACLLAEEILPEIELEEPLVHVHCHQKALGQQVDGMAIPSTCCGMAGGFGYEAEHYAFSRAIGELSLLPAVRKAPQSTPLIANGFSCRSQIAHFTQRRAMHLFEYLRSCCPESRV